jgi:hypothetical protein
MLSSRAGPNNANASILISKRNNKRKGEELVSMSDLKIKLQIDNSLRSLMGIVTFKNVIR